MFKFLKNMCGHCGCGSPSEEKKSQYKCKYCGKTSEKADKCCSGTMEKECGCGSGKYARGCCES